MVELTDSLGTFNVPVRFSTVYAHLTKSYIPTDRRVYVKRGESMGEMGRSGNQQATHLHFGVVDREQWKIDYNPHLFWADGPGIITCYDPNERYPSKRYPSTFVTTFPLEC